MDPGITQMLVMVNKDFKTAIMKMFENFMDNLVKMNEQIRISK